MLNEYRDLYRSCANLIGDWKHKTILELATKYLFYRDKNDDIYNSYISAIICRFWYTISNNYTKQELKIATEEDCYDWLIKSVMYVLDHHVWTDPESTIYNDKDGPTKAILVRIESEKINFFVAYTRAKRCINKNKLYLEDLAQCVNSDTYSYDWALPPINDKDNLFDNFIENKIISFFNEKKFFSAFALDAIINNNVFKEIIENNYRYICFEPKKIKHYFRHTDDSFCRVFSSRYNLNYNDVLNSIKYIINISDEKFDVYLNNFILTLRHDDIIMNEIMG